ncbi:MAG: GAF domain-containing protein [Fidelibacterota bacterium]
MKDKNQRYEKVLESVKAVLLGSGQDLSIVARMALVASILRAEFFDWVFCGFYQVVDNHLEIGPYQGEVLACSTIAFGRGVCGVAAEKQNTVIVDDVNQFPGYIACDSETISEIVVPVFTDHQLVAVLDVDSPQTAAFDDTDKKYLEQIVKIMTL